MGMQQEVEEHIDTTANRLAAIGQHFMNRHWRKRSSHELAVDWSCNEAVRGSHTFPGSTPAPARSEGSAMAIAAIRITGNLAGPNGC